jgi:CRISPR-associated protein Cas6/Cse3/CasE subtype I-E
LNSNRSSPRSTSPRRPGGDGGRSGASGEGFVHSVLSFTRLEIPEVEVFETVVTFTPQTDPLAAHERLSEVFGHKAGDGYFLFRADSEMPGRYWVRSLEPWPSWPRDVTTALEPSRRIIQLETGLMYQFTLRVCTGHERVEGGQKHIQPFATPQEFESWFAARAAECGFKLLMHSGAVDVMRFGHDGKNYKVGIGALDGALEVVDATPMKRAILRGFGSHRRLGLGMLQLSS